MPQATRRVVRHRKVSLLAEGLYKALVGYVSAQVVASFVAACGCVFRQRLYPPAITLWAMVAQALSNGLSDRATVYRLAAHFGRQASPRSGAYCAARQRMPRALLRRATRYLAQQAPQHCSAIPGSRVFVLDGSNFTLADTPQNQARYPQPTSQAPGCGFPVLHFVALFDLATGCLVDLVCGSLKTGESRLARPLYRHLKPGDFLIIDRGFASYRVLATLHQRGVHVIARQHASRKNQLPLRGPLTDHQETWERPASTSGSCPSLPASLTVRVVSCLIQRRERLILNTLLDDTQISAQALCALYRRRWEIETALGHLKTTLGLDSVYPKRPRTARQALWAHALAYNFLCRLLLDASIEHGIPRDRLSLKAAADALTESRMLVIVVATEVHVWVIQAIARDQRAPRPDRNEPRVIKRRPKQYGYMTQPRDQLKLNPPRGKPK